MAPQPTYPGVYIREIPSGVRTITGVATSIAAFIDYFKRGPMDEAVQIFNMGDFKREFGGLDAQSEASYAIQQFFLNGGTEAWVVRTASGNVGAANVQILSGIGGATAFTVEAINPGDWGDGLQVSIDHLTPTSENRFNMTVSLMERQNGETSLVRSEVFRNLSMNPTDPNFVETVINDRFSGSKLVNVRQTAEGGQPPLQTGTLSGPLAPDLTLTVTENPQLNVTIGTEGTGTAILARVPESLSDAMSLLEAAIRAARLGNRAFSEASVTIVDNHLRILAGPTAASSLVIFAAGGSDPAVTDLGLSTALTLEGILSGNIAGVVLSSISGDLEVAIGGGVPTSITLDPVNINDLSEARDHLEARIREENPNTPAFANARVIVHSDAGEERLIVLAGVPNADVAFSGQAAIDLELGVGTVTPGATPIQALVSANLSPIPSIAANSAVAVQIGAEGPHTATMAAADTLADIATALQAAIRDIPAFTGARVAAFQSGSQNELVVLAGVPGDTVVFTPAPVDGTTVVELLLNEANADANVQAYVLGTEEAILDSAQGAGTPGNNGNPPDAAALIGVLNDKTGIHALEDVDLFNILCLPRTAIVSGDNRLTADQAAAVMTEAITYCEKHRAFFIVDTPNDIDEVQEVKEWLDTNDNLRRKNAAFYFPRVQIPDPLNNFRLRSVGASGTMAGLYARTDGTRGVWKAPAGTEATLNNVRQLDYTLSDAENGTLNPLGINCLRSFPIYGKVSWGARTLVGADQMASEWKYVPVRRLALFLEESLFRGTQWVVFEPNDEPLWAQIRLNIGAFMHNLFRQGAFQGQTPRDAYFVKCDHETTTQNDINLGIVNIVVGFAPLKPAEFVIISIQQIAGQIVT